MPITAPDVFAKELERFAQLRGTKKSPNKALIQALCRALQDQLLEHYDSGGPKDEQLKRLAEISLMFRSTKFKVGKRVIKVAAKGVDGDTVIGLSKSEYGREDCPPGMRCVDGNCVS